MADRVRLPPRGHRRVRAWRLALLLALGGTVLFASFSYDEWVLIHGYLTSGLWHERRQRAHEAERRAEMRRREQDERRDAEIQGSVRDLFRGSVHALAVLPDGGLLAGGWHSAHGLALARLRANGSLDRKFADRVAKAGVTGMVSHISVESDGRMLLRGTFVARQRPRVDLRILSVHQDGAVDEEFLERALRGEVQPPREEITYPPGAALGARVGLQGSPALRVNFATSGPGGTTVVFYSERVPEPPPPPGVFVMCGNDEGRAQFRHGVSFFDSERRRVWRAEVPQAAIKGVLVQSDGRMFVRGWLRQVKYEGPQSTENDVLLWRVDRHGLDAGFHTLRRSELGRERPAVSPDVTPDIRAMAVLADGRIVIAGDFNSVRGQPRVHIACLRADGVLEEYLPRNRLPFDRPPGSQATSRPWRRGRGTSRRDSRSEAECRREVRRTGRARAAPRLLRSTRATPKSRLAVRPEGHSGPATTHADRGGWDQQGTINRCLR